MSSNPAAVTLQEENTFFSQNGVDRDPEVFAAMDYELHRQRNQIELIASENIVSRAVLQAQGSVMTNKYAEGYPGKRYYGGCEFVDVAENLAIERAKKIVLAFDKAEKKGINVVSIRSKMIDPPVVKRALHTMNMAIINGLVSKNWKPK